jgi:hypothetical protein
MGRLRRLANRIQFACRGVPTLLRLSFIKTYQEKTTETI